MRVVGKILPSKVGKIDLRHIFIRDKFVAQSVYK
jgi:hypothetical protein